MKRATTHVTPLHLMIVVKKECPGSVKLLSLSNILFQNILLVESLDYNLLSVSQLCEMGYNCLFTNEGVIVFRISDGSISLNGVLKGKLYLEDFTLDKAQLDTCLIPNANMG